MATDFIPRRDADLVTWSQHFFSLINAAPTTYGLTAIQASAYGELQDDFVTLFNAAANANTRTPSGIIARGAAKTALVDRTRELARIIQAFPATTNIMRSDLGIALRGGEPTPVPAPAFAPDVDFVSVIGRTVKMRLHDSQSPTRRGKPAGVSGASVFSYVGAEPPADISDWKFEGNTTRTTVEITLESSAAPGAKVWVTAFWFNPAAQSGPACDPVSTHLQGGGVEVPADGGVIVIADSRWGIADGRWGIADGRWGIADGR